MKKIFLALLITILLISCLFVLNSCDKPENYEKEVNVFYLNEKYNTKVNLIVNDSITYISYEDFIPLLYRGREYKEGRDEFTVSKEDNRFIITPSNGMVGIFDVEENTFETANFSLFKNTHFLEGGIAGATCYDGLPFIKVESVELDKEPEKMFIDFDDYSIDIFEKDGSLYIPITTLSNMYSGQNLIVCLYNGSDIYVYCNVENELYNSFGKHIFDGIQKQKITQSLADFNYNNLCLNYDYFLGRSGRSALESYYDLSSGLDSALESDEFGRYLKKCLKTNNLYLYLAAKNVFASITKDGGHTRFDSYQIMAYTENGVIKAPFWRDYFYKKLIEFYTNDILKYDTGIIKKVCQSYAHHNEVYEARKNMLNKAATALYGEKTYTRVDDTAIIHIDGYMNEIYNQKAWNDYYNGKTDVIPFDKEKGGVVGAIYFGLIKANEDNVKRVIIDLSANTGGSSDEMLYVISLLTNQSTLNMYDQITKQVYTTSYLIDRNLDRVFDEKDKEFDLIGDKELAILISQNGFSCGGISSVLLHEYGLYSLGDNCGGGSCAIYYQHDAYALFQASSSPYQICDLYKVDIDTARTSSCDTKLEIKVDKKTGKYDYSAFFDIENLNKLIDEHYANVTSE